MLLQNRFITLRAGRYDRDRHFTQLFEAIQVRLSIDRQILPALDAESRPFPTRHRFVNRLTAGNVICADRQQVNHLVAQFITGADLDFLQTIKHIQLGNTQAGQAIDTRRATQQGRIKPATTALTSRYGTEFLANAKHLVTRRTFGIDIEFTREGAATDARTVSLGNTQNVMQHARANTGTCSSLTSHAVR